MIRIGLIVVVTLFLAGCSQMITPNTPDSTTLSPPKTLQVAETQETAISSTQVMDIPDRIDLITTKMPERVSPTEVTAPVTGEVPSKLLDAILADLAMRVGVVLEMIAVIQAQAIVWNDGSLGCARPGVMYTQALVNGYWVILEVNGKKFDYRASETGYFFLCEKGSPPISPPSTPSS